MPDLAFDNPFRHGFIRLGAAVPEVRLGNPALNARSILELVKQAKDANVDCLTFPELSLTGYAIEDLHQQQSLQQAVEAEIGHIAKASQDHDIAFIIGAPLIHLGRLYNCGLVFHKGRILGAVPKTHLANSGEFYEARWFTSGQGTGGEITLAGQSVPFGAGLLFQVQIPEPKISESRIPETSHFCFHVEICEDLWAPIPPSSLAALSGAEVIFNLSASNGLIGKARTRRMICAAQSLRCLAAYVYAASGTGESTTDLVFDGHGLICEAGKTMVETQRFANGASLIFADIDLSLLRAERLRSHGFREAGATVVKTALLEDETNSHFRVQTLKIQPKLGSLGLARKMDRFPYFPSDTEVSETCSEIYRIQIEALKARLKATGQKALVIGVSAGLDSTLALMVAARVMDELQLSRQQVFGYSLPGFATSETTKTLSEALMTALSVSRGEIDICKTATMMLKDLGHPAGDGEALHDTTFENVQAGLRTDYLFRLANHLKALVVGTGDLSEQALGWSTYGVGDHMSHYNPNVGLPKTVIKAVIHSLAHQESPNSALREVLLKILEREITPELVPSPASAAAQSTEASIGPYDLHDFFLYYMLRYGFSPPKIAYLAHCAWRDKTTGDWPDFITAKDRKSYDLSEVKTWLAVFYQRFFTNQFKRSAMPNGPKILMGGGLSPRSDWRMPSDVKPATWLATLEQIPG